MALEESPVPEDAPVLPFTLVESITGKVVSSGTTMHFEGLVGIGQRLIEGVAAPLTSYLKGSQFKPYPPQPSEFYKFDYVAEVWFDPRSIPDLRLAASARIDAAYTAATRAISAGYPLEERESWPVQTGEARALRVDNSAPTPWIDAAADVRGLTREDLAARIVALDDAYRGVHGRMSGTRQKLQQRLADAETAAALAAITWPLDPP